MTGEEKSLISDAESVYSDGELRPKFENMKLNGRDKLKLFSRVMGERLTLIHNTTAAKFEGKLKGKFSNVYEL